MYRFWKGKVDRVDASHHFGLVALIASKSCRLKPGEILEETEEFADGLVGLAKAIKGFKLIFNCQFSTFAFLCIRNEIWSGAKRRRRENIGAIPLSRFDTDDINFELGEVDPALDDFETNQQMRDLVTISPSDSASVARKKQILYMLFFEKYTLKETGEHFCIGRERVRQIKEQTLDDLRRKFAGEDYDSVCAG